MQAALRVAYLVSQYPAFNHTFILREILALRSREIDIKVIAIRGDNRTADAVTATERLEQQQTVTVLPFGSHFLKAHIATVIRRPAGYFAGLLLALKLGGYNIRSVLFHFIYFLEAVVAGDMAQSSGFCHLHSHFSSTVGLIAARVFGFTLSITIHGPAEFQDVIGFRLREKVAASRFIATISSYARSQIMLASHPDHWKKIEVCRLGVDTSIFRPEPARDSSAGEFKVICIGRLDPIKAQQILIAACGELISRGWKLKLHLIGSGSNLFHLQQLTNALGLNANVVFEGPRNQDEIIGFYQQADIFALASFAEGVPVVLMEAMAMEVPCVATWVNGIPELIHHEEEGLLIAPSDQDELTGALERLLKSADLRRKLGQAARQRVLRDYDLERNTARLAELFHKYLST